MPSGTLLYAQSGGVTAVINATAAAVIEAARKRRVKVLAARNGILGALREELVDASRLPLVRQLMNHADFNIRNPNRARSVIFSYCSANPGGFHRSDAAGYVFWSDRVIELDGINPQVAARLARALDRWKKLAEPQRSAAREAIARVAAKPDLSNDVREVVTRALAE